jgi:murein DD-endopeptidase MepM/ murein hydrolase activator NlpD
MPIPGMRASARGRSLDTVTMACATVAATLGLGTPRVLTQSRAPDAAPDVRQPVNPEASLTLETPRPTAWAPSPPERCIRRGRMRSMCSGRLLIPADVPPPDAHRALELGLGTPAAAQRLLLAAPDPRWVVAASAAPSPPLGDCPRPRAEAAAPDASPWEPPGLEARAPSPPLGDCPRPQAEATPSANGLDTVSGSEPRLPPTTADGTSAAAGLRFPLDAAALWRGYATTRRGRRRHNHLGIDLGAPAGTPFRAADRGLVAYVGNDLRGYGNMALVVHPSGTVTLYAHARALYVRAGALVARGQVLGEVGATGFAHGAHLHFEVHEAGVARNPLPRFAALPRGITLPPAALDDRVLSPDPSLRHRPARRRGGVLLHVPPGPRRRGDRALSSRGRPTPSQP